MTCESCNDKSNAALCDYCIKTNHTKTNPLNPLAPKGMVYQCQACGKKSKDKYGFHKISYGWDESCMLNSALVEDKKVVSV